MATDFDRAVKYVAETTSMQASNEDKLRFYKYYKQATVGDVTGERPGFLNAEKRAKYDSWASVKGLSAQEAQLRYVELLDKLAPHWRSQ